VRNNAGFGTRILQRRGSTAQKGRWLREIASGKVRTAFALTEPGAGSDAAAITTRAERRGNGYVLNGTKQYISNGENADLVTVIAYTDPAKGRRGITAFLVEKGTPGLEVARVERTMAGPPDYVAQLTFTDCLVPRDAVIGEEGKGFYYAMENLNEGRTYVSALAVGMAHCALEDALAYAKQRVAFGQALAEFQAVRHVLADSATEIHAAQLMLHDAATRQDSGGNPAQQCAMAKLFATEMAGRVIDRSLQVHGGYGYLRGTRVERLYREVRLLRIVEGASEMGVRSLQGTVQDYSERLQEPLGITRRDGADDHPTTTDGGAPAGAR
jgi:alkylation response protein AidB-like acyl-CoA dehydrogenase